MFRVGGGSLKIGSQLGHTCIALRAFKSKLNTNNKYEKKSTKNSRREMRIAEAIIPYVRKVAVQRNLKGFLFVC